MKKSMIKLAVASALTIGATAANATALDANSILTFSASAGGFGAVPVDAGAWFGMETGGAGSPILYTGITSVEGLKLDGLSQFAEAEFVDGIADNGSLVQSVDATWDFFGATGVHGSTGISVLDNTAANTATIDFSGWYVSYNNIANISMGGDPVNFPADTQIATITCAVDCSVGDTYSLDYAAHVPLSSAAFPGTAYVLHLEGIIAAPVPVPAAVWLFGSGLLGLVGVARRRKTA